MPDQVPTTPIVPTTPTAGQGAPDQWNAHRLAKMLEQQQGQEPNQPFKRIYYKTIGKGSLISFEYLAWIHDPYPLILVSALYTHPPRPGLVAGVNLHYLTFKFIKNLIKNYCGKQFYYTQIKNNIYIYNSFRTYRRDKLRLVKQLDCEYLMQILGAVRSYKPTEIEAIRKYIQEQLRRKTNPTAEDIAKEYSQMIHNDPRGAKYTEAGHQLGKLYGKMPQPPVIPPYGKQTRGDARFNPIDMTPPQ
jgi:hypothetical protein